ncbi:hypothetical protein BGZ75_002224 [Mortierella antarctica]|nr:hypothetical protein BGZ75_002224 [Mortierella antarctica]
MCPGDYGYSSPSSVKLEPEDAVFANSHGLPHKSNITNNLSNNNNNSSSSSSNNNSNRSNAFEDDNSVDQATLVKYVRNRIAEIDRDFPRLARTKAKIQLELDRHDPRGALHARLLAQHQNSLQTFADLKKRRDTMTEVLADLLLTQGPQQPQQPQSQGQLQPQPSIGAVSTVRVNPDQDPLNNHNNNSSSTAERVLELKADMPRYGADKRRTYTTSPEEFLYRFEMHLKTYLGSERFEKECYRYMVVLTTYPGLQNQLFEEFEDRDKATLTFSECAKVFRRLTGR